jgi:hypothetical protein
MQRGWERGTKKGGSVNWCRALDKGSPTFNARARITLVLVLDEFIYASGCRERISRPGIEEYVYGV